MLKQFIALSIILIAPIYGQTSPVPIEEVPNWVLTKKIEIPTGIPIKDINNGIYYLDLDNQIKVEKDKKTVFYSRHAELVVNQKGLSEVS